MALSEIKVERIRVEYEVGIITLDKMAKRYNLAKRTIIRMSKKLLWVRGKNQKNVTKLIEENVTKEMAERFSVIIGREQTRKNKISESVTKNVTKNIVTKETNKLVDYSTAHLKHIKTLRTLSGVNTSDLVKKAKKDKDLSSIDRKEAERILAIQRVLELAMKTHDLAYKSERLAMGIKDSETTPVNINIGKVEDFSKLTDDELNLIIAGTEVN